MQLTIEPVMDDPIDEAHLDRSIREQNRFLDHCVEHGIELTAFLMSGTRLVGVALEHDRKCILFGVRNKDPILMLKSYLALIRPNTPIELFIQYRGMGTAMQRKQAAKKAKKLAAREKGGVQRPLKRKDGKSAAAPGYKKRGGKGIPAPACKVIIKAPRRLPEPLQE